MSHSSSTPAGASARLRIADARDGNARPLAWLEALLALLATVLGRRRHLAAPWHPRAHEPLPADALFASCATLAPDPDDEAALRWDALCRALLRQLYVLGPRRNRGMAARPRALPDPRPRTARAPPLLRLLPSGAITPLPQGMPTHAH